MCPRNKFYNICKLSCLAPISSNPRTQRALTVYSWITVAGLILDTIFGFTIDIFGDGFIVSSLVTSAVFLSMIIGHIVAIVESLVKRDEQNRFFAKLDELDDMFLFKLRYKMSFQRKRRKLIFKYSIISVIVFLNFFLYIGMILSHEYRGFFWHGILSIPISRIRFIQISVYVELITCRFDHLNLLLKQMANCKLHRKNRILDVDYSAIDNPERIFILKAVYVKLHDTVCCFNDIFGWSSLTLIIYYCLDLTCNSYWQFLAWEEYIPSAANYESFVTILSLTLVLTLLCHTCYECVNRSNNTRNLVQKMVLTSSDEHTNYLLNQFLMQIHHLPIVFHSKMFFSVDLKLLTSICASIIGYLVILIQFRYTENEL